MSRSRSLLGWIAIVRLLAVPVAMLQILISNGAPPHHDLYAWIITACLAVGGTLLLQLARRRPAAASASTARTRC